MGMEVHYSDSWNASPSEDLIQDEPDPNPPSDGSFDGIRLGECNQKFHKRVKRERTARNDMLRRRLAEEEIDTPVFISSLFLCLLAFTAFYYLHKWWTAKRALPSGSPARSPERNEGVTR